MTAWEVGFDNEKEDDKPEALIMEHFHLPLGMWFVGLLLSLLCFIAEILYHRITRLEEPSVTPEADVEHNRDGEDIEDTEL